MLNKKKEKLIIEASSRMQILELSDSIVKQFINEGTVFVSCEPNGLMVEIDEYDIENNEFIDSFEEENDCVVYLIIKGVYNIKTDVGSVIPEYLDAIFYVSLSEIEEWQSQKDNLKNGLANVYIRDNEYPKFSHFEQIKFVKNNAGLSRSDVPMGEDINGRMLDFVGMSEELFEEFIRRLYA